MSHLRMFNDPVLRMPCDPVAGNDDQAYIHQVLLDVHNGVGLAAPQIGVLKRACVIWHRRRGGERVVMINPRIVSHSRTVVAGEEACLSYPGIVVQVERFEHVEVEWTDQESWLLQQRTFTGFQGRVVQHELDHLDGRCRVGDAWRASLPSVAGLEAAR